MLVSDLFLQEKFIFPKPYNPKGIDPSLMTFQEYYDLVNPTGREHESSSYDYPLKKFNQKKSDFPKLLQRIKLKDLYFEIRLNENPGFGGKFEIAAFDEDQCVGKAQDEWGAMLIMVPREYRGFGLGPILGKFARQLEPAKDSGGLTPAGYNNLMKVYRSYVQDALTTGKYSKLIKAREISLEKVKQIVSSAKLNSITKKSEDIRYDTSKPSNWLFYYSGSTFIIYDKSLKERLEDEKENDYWTEKCIKGLLTFEQIFESDHLIIITLGGDDKIKSFLLNCFCSLASEEGYIASLDSEYIQYIDNKSIELDEPNNSTGYKRYNVNYIGKPIDLEILSKPEKEFRKFDKYHEFEIKIHEMAELKYK